MKNRKTILCIALLLTGCSGLKSPHIATPPVDQLPAIASLPDPFVMQDGKRVKTGADWQRRRAELKELFAYYEYGHMPPRPNHLTAQVITEETLDNGVTRRHVLLTMGPQQAVQINVGLVIPAGDGPFPVIIRNDADIFNIPATDMLTDRGYMVVDYNRLDLDPDKPDSVGPAQLAYPDYDWATLAVWAWGGMRVIDYLVTLDCVDTDKLVFTGHSRGGKTALLAGSMDERIALTVPNGSGCGGAGCFRLEGDKCETLALITDPKRFAYWFQPRFREFADREERLPFDQHTLRALVAPRGLLTTDSTDDIWANPYGTQKSYQAALKVYEWMGAGDNIAIHFRKGGHDQNIEDWTALADFADKFFFNKARKDGTEFNQLPFE